MVVENHQGEMNDEKSQENWSEQKNRMDAMLLKLKNEIQDVKTMDKDLTRQFITLGGQINKIKNEQLFEEDDYEDDDIINEEENLDVEDTAEGEEKENKEPVSYTHLTLPTKA